MGGDHHRRIGPLDEEALNACRLTARAYLDLWPAAREVW